MWFFKVETLSTISFTYNLTITHMDLVASGAKQVKLLRYDYGFKKAFKLLIKLN